MRMRHTHLKHFKIKYTNIGFEFPIKKKKKWGHSIEIKWDTVTFRNKKTKTNQNQVKIKRESILFVANAFNEESKTQSNIDMWF